MSELVAKLGGLFVEPVRQEEENSDLVVTCTQAIFRIGLITVGLSERETQLLSECLTVRLNPDEDQSPGGPRYELYTALEDECESYDYSILVAGADADPTLLALARASLLKRDCSVSLALIGNEVELEQDRPELGADLVIPAPSSALRLVKAPRLLSRPYWQGIGELSKLCLSSCSERAEHETTIH